MATKKFSNSSDALDKLMDANSVSVVDKTTVEKVESVKTEKQPEAVSAVKSSDSPIPTKAAKAVTIKEQANVVEKFVTQSVKYSLTTSLRMERVLSRMKELDPDESRKYSKKYFVDEAIEKLLDEYEKSLDLK